MPQGSPTTSAGRIRIGIIGCGKIAINHVQALHGIDGVEVLAVADVDPDRAQSFARTYGIPSAYCRRRGDVGFGPRRRDGLQPTLRPRGRRAGGRARMASMCCARSRSRSAWPRLTGWSRRPPAAGVLIRRPVSTSILARVGRGFGAAIDDGRLGPLISGGLVARFNRDAEYYAEPWRGRWATEGGGVLMTQAIHHVDLLQWFMGPATRVTGRFATLAHRDFIEVEDTASAIIEFASGRPRDRPGRHDLQPGTRRAGLGQRRPAAVPRA